MKNNDDVKTESAKTPEPKKTEAPAPSKEPLYVATTPILFNNVEYIDGDPIKVTGEQAAQLLSVGAIRELKKKENRSRR
jgi:hypothetical protein